ncbi:hypothetical protein [Metapseudomonas otitidis]|uniref:hypothetical protein n=1 Tax=Metapseudomonas otitidis TaxID=319939 RepID=UPI0013F65C18|nr:hypothetical protein [Pseudomonas otitidis]
MRALISSAVIAGLISGCATPETEDTRFVGFSEGRFIDESSNTFKTRFWKPSESSTECLKEGDIFEVRLQSLKINQEFEGTLEKLTSDKGNELGVFLTVSKSKTGDQSAVADAEGKNTKDDATLVRPVERRLVYVTDSRYPDVDINSANLIVFGDKYTGSDYKFTFEVVEFDSDSIKKYGTIAKEMARDGLK